MATAFQLRIVTPNRLLVDEQVREVTGPGTLGEFGVFPDHITLLTSLEIGAMSFRTDRGVQRLAVRGGFAEVMDNVMTVLADDAALPEDIDPTKVRGELQSAEAALQSLSPLEEAYFAAEASRKWAQTRLEVAATR